MWTEHEAEKTAKEALISNLAIAVAKLAAAVLTGSIGMAAETIHSFSDTLNQTFVLIGIKKSKKAPDKEHPFGYGKERFLWPFLVATLLFSITGIFSAQLGIFPILQNSYEPLRNVEVGYIVLAGAGILEAKALKSAFSTLRKKIESKDGGGGRENQMNLKTILTELRENKEPALMTVIAEDVVAIFGVAVTLFGIFLSKTTGYGLYDATSAVAVGAVMMSFAFFLAREFKGLLVGKAISQDEVDKIIDILSMIPEVKRIVSVKTMHVSTEDILVAVDLILIEQVKEEETPYIKDEDKDKRSNNNDFDYIAHITGRIEHQIKQVLPHTDKSKIYIKYVR